MDISTKDSYTAATITNVPRKPCHNCRRSRLRCDESLPTCNKCLRNGEECLGYQKFFSWVNGVASRGKMVGKSFDNVKRTKKIKETPAPVNLQDERFEETSLTVAPKTPIIGQHIMPLTRFMSDPLFQDLDQNSRFFLSYFDTHVCKDLVIYDKPYQNHYRDLLPFTREYKSLLHVILATSALHFSNALERHHTISTAELSSDLAVTEKSSGSINPLVASPQGVYHYALIAKQRALRLLSLELRDPTQTNIMVTLACVLLFIDLELIDSGKNNWRPHVEGSRMLMEHLASVQDIRAVPTGFLMDSLISGCLVYEILGTTLTKSTQSPAFEISNIDVSPLLTSAEANHYLSCPSELLQILKAVPQLQTNTTTPSLQTSSISTCQADHSSLLLQRAQKFDSEAWATTLRDCSPRNDREKRVHIASAHKAAVCIYIMEALPAASDISGMHGIEHLASEICAHVALITIDDDLVKSTCWPLFVAAATTTDPGRWMWVLARLNELWEQMPCGYVKSAIEILEAIWKRRAQPGTIVNWVQELKVLGVDWLIA